MRFVYVECHHLSHRYEAEIKQLRQELALQDALAGRTGVRYGPLDASEKEHFISRLQTFLAAPPEASLEARTLREIDYGFKLLKDMILQFVSILLF